MELRAITGSILISIWTQSYNPAPEYAISGVCLGSTARLRGMRRIIGRPPEAEALSPRSLARQPSRDVPKRPNAMEDMQAG